MKILGIKLSHDGAIALIDNGKLVFSYEMEKLGNNARLQSFNLSLGEIQDILNTYNYSIEGLDIVSIDGWMAGVEDQISRGHTEFEPDFFISRDNKLSENLIIDIVINKYGVIVSETENVLRSTANQFEPLGLPYVSYMHVSGHLFGAYCTSPFAKEKESSFVLVWDGAMPPQLFHYDGVTNQVENCGPLFLLVGSVYPDLAFQFPPFNEKWSYSISGKLMAYVALGKLNEDILQWFNDSHKNLEKKIQGPVTRKAIDQVSFEFIEEAKLIYKRSKVSIEDFLCTFHVFLENLLLERLEAYVRKSRHSTSNLCFAGGCALSIKWNSKIRSLDLFKNVWVPPFPNDSGSAIGTACCAMVDKTGNSVLEWDVYAGPDLVRRSNTSPAYNQIPLSITDLGKLLFETGEPVLVLNGRAELGPRALGNRSIISPAVAPTMKALLNKIKGREDYRPVAPICLEEFGPEIFIPGSPDPYMLFDHTVKETWKDRIPAIVHIDGSARLQTITKAGNPVIHELLTSYNKHSGIPVLCNTSANFNGKGFFPDVISAMEWDAVNYIWSDNILYERREKLTF